jgi:hypothetical protein
MLDVVTEIWLLLPMVVIVLVFTPTEVSDKTIKMELYQVRARR